MLYQAVCHLKRVEDNTKEPPSYRWFQTWLKSTSTIHTIKTKPIAKQRVEIHTEQDVYLWFENELKGIISRLNICHGNQIYNMDEKGTRCACPSGEEIVVPIHIKEIYTATPENRKSLTIIECISADGKELPPCIIIPGEKHMVSWYNDNMTGLELIQLSPTGYTNEAIAMEWLSHFIKHSSASPDAPWKILLLDGHVSHNTPNFITTAITNHI